MLSERPFRADLHVHSVFSDGLKTPAQLCAMADRYAPDAIALCDHDTVEGLPAMAQAVAQRNVLRAQEGRLPMIWIPAVEVSTGRGGRTHLLCYGADVQNVALADFLRGAADDRRIRACRMLELIKTREGLCVPDDDGFGGPCMGRAHIARAMVRAGLVSSVQHAFDRYLGEGCSAYVPRSMPPTGSAVAMLRDMGLTVVLAHPVRMGLDWPALQAQLLEWQACGLAGVEAYHPSASHRWAQLLDRFARANGLLVSGGSDYHGDADSRARLGRLPAAWHDARQDVAALCDAMAHG